MTKTLNARHSAKAKILKALAHPVRVMIVEAVAARRICVCELTDMSGLDISSVSRHLLILRTSGILDMKREGVKIYYSLRCPCIVKFLKCLDGIC